MRVLEPSRRVLVLLLGCLVTALVFPQACSKARVRIGALLPATASAALEPHADAAAASERAATLEEQLAVSRHLRLDLQGRLAARPAGDRPPLDRLVVPSTAEPGRPRRGVAARILHRDLSRTRSSFLIDVGSEDGLRRGLAVVHGDSLVGVVEVVAANAARVRRVDDPRWDGFLPAAVVGAGDTGEAALRGEGVARGDGGGGLEIEYLGDAGAQVGDFALTGAGRESVPAGLVLGRVNSYEDDDRDGAWIAHVTPLRALDEVQSVIVLLADPLPAGLVPRKGPR